MISEYQKKSTTTLHPSAVESKSSYQKGSQAREKACATVRESELTENGTDISHGSSLLIEPLEDDHGISEMMNVTNFIEIENNCAEPITEHQREIPIEKNQPEIITRKRPLAQANIMAPKRKRCNTNLKNNTVKYLETKSEKQHELRCRELGLQERKQLLAENKFEMDRKERQKRLEIEERRLEMEEKRLKVELDLFANQQELIRILFNK